MVARANQLLRYDPGEASRIEPPIGLSEKIVRRRPIPIFREIGRALRSFAAAILISASVTALLLKWSERRHRPLAGAQEILVTGEVLDMTLLHRLQLERSRYAECARVCIRNGLPGPLKLEAM